MPAKKKFDAIVIGGGHNGLVNGAYLAKAGLEHPDPRATASGRRRRHHRGAASRFQLHHLLLCA